MLGGGSVSLIVVSISFLLLWSPYSEQYVVRRFQVGGMGVIANALRKSTLTGPQSHIDLSRVSWCWYLLFLMCVWCVPFSDCFSFLMLFGLPVDVSSPWVPRIFVCVIPLLA